MKDHLIKIKSTCLKSKHICDLIEGNIYAILIKNFYEKTILDFVQVKILSSKDKGAMQHANEFNRIGYAYSEINTEEQRTEYHQNALKNFSIIQELFSPSEHPIDAFTSLLQKVWPFGAGLLEINRQKCFIGICRLMNPLIDLKPHTDRVERNLPPNCGISLASQLSANLYIKMPEDGGEIEFWDMEPTEEQYNALKGNRHYGISRDLLPKASYTYKPEQGDLLILNSHRIHAVRPVTDEPRITLSCFVGYHAMDLPLSYWS